MVIVPVFIVNYCNWLWIFVDAVVMPHPSIGNHKFRELIARKSLLLITGPRPE
jgi:hypothetical protein